MTDREFAWLRDYLANPDALRPPQAVLPYLAWPGRTTLLAGAEKCGKTELLRQAVAKVSRGDDFLGQPTHPITTCWFALDEPDADTARGLLAFGANPDRVAIRCTRFSDGDHLIALVRETKAELVIFDTLSALVTGLVTKSGDAAQWGPLLAELVRMTRETGAATIWNHHAGKGTGVYRDSSDIGARVDMILEIQPFTHGETGRNIRVKGRLPLRDFKLDFVDGNYQLADGAEPDHAPVEHRSEASRKLLRLIRDSEPEGLTSGAWQKMSGLTRETYNRHRRPLITAGLVLQPDVTGTKRYRISDRGQADLAGVGTTMYHDVPMGPNGTSEPCTTCTKGQSMSLVRGVQSVVQPDPAVPASLGTYAEIRAAAKGAS